MAERDDEYRDADIDEFDSEMFLRRDAVRLPLRLWTEGLVDGRLDFHNCSNLSVGGIFIESEEPYELGKIVQIEFNLPGVYDPVKVTGEVVSEIADDGTGDVKAGNGFKFLDLNEADRQLIEKFIEASLEEESIF